MHELEPLVLLEDEPVPSHLVDELGLVPFARVVAGTAVGTTGPFTIGVFADWGQGKSSVLRQSKSLIETDERLSDVVTVWFNAWQYEREEHPILPLVDVIVRDVERKREERGNRASKAIREAWSTIARTLRAVAYGFSAETRMGLPAVGEIKSKFAGKEMIDQYEKLQDDGFQVSGRSLYHDSFEALSSLGKGAAGAIPKIVVFIDDLDRCLPPQGLKLLESIKLVLSQTGFIFVLGVDRRILEGYLANRYRTEFGVQEYAESGTSYLDKIVQLSLTLPPHRSRFGDFIDQLLARKSLDVESNVPVRQALKELGRLLAVGSNYNPRNLVRFVNNLIVDRSIWMSLGEEVGVDRLGLCAVSRILQQHLGDRLYKFLVSSDTTCTLLARAQAADASWFERAEPPDEAGLKGGVERMRQELTNRIQQAEFLTELLGTSAGKRWLSDHSARAEVNEFLLAREEVPSIAVPQHQIVDSAIRGVVGLPEDSPISDENLKMVTRMELTQTEIDDSGLVHLKKLSGLRELYLDNTRVTDEGLEHLGGLSQLRELYLSNTRVNGSGLRYIVGLVGLSWLALGGTRVYDSALDSLEGLIGLSVLYLDRTQIGDGGMDHIGRLENLSSLYLDDTRVGDSGMENLKGLRKLIRLYLNNTRVGNDGLNHLQGLRVLTVLYVDGTRVSDRGFASLELPALNELSVANTAIGDATLERFQEFTSLRTLYLTGTRITDDGLGYLGQLDKLRELSLGNTQVTDEAVKYLRPMRSLERLAIGGTNISEAGREEIGKLLPDCVLAS